MHFTLTRCNKAAIALFTVPLILSAVVRMCALCVCYGGGVDVCSLRLLRQQPVAMVVGRFKMVHPKFTVAPSLPNLAVSVCSFLFGVKETPPKASHTSTACPLKGRWRVRLQRGTFAGCNALKEGIATNKS
jgi:hypothetical protein